MKLALVHDWLPVFCGAEKVLYALSELYKAPIYTLIHDSNNPETSVFHDSQITTSFIQNLPYSATKYRYYFPLFPYAVEQFDLNEYDVILSNSNAVAKGVLTSYRQLHICYCHTPMRYCWDLYFQYFNNCSQSILVRNLAKMVFHYLRFWDVASANRVDHFIAISRHVEQRINKTYRRKCSKVIYPPVDVEGLKLSDQDEGYYITVSRLVPYKRVDLLIKAFNSMKNMKLVIIGKGPEYEALKSIAGSNIELLGYQTSERMKHYLYNAKAFVFAGEEDFGITLVEAQAAGLPVIAYCRGGAAETVLNDVTGVHFPNQDIISIIEAVQRFEKSQHRFDPVRIRNHSQKFSTERFKKEMSEFVNQSYHDFQSFLNC